MRQDFVKDGGLRSVADFVLGVDTFLMAIAESDDHSVVTLTPNPSHYTVGGTPPYLFMLGYFAKILPVAAAACGLDFRPVVISVRKNDLGLTDQVKMFVPKGLTLANADLMYLGRQMKTLKEAAVIFHQNYTDYSSNFQARETVLARQVKAF